MLVAELKGARDRKRRMTGKKVEVVRHRHDAADGLSRSGSKREGMTSAKRSISLGDKHVNACSYDPHWHGTRLCAGGRACGMSQHTLTVGAAAFAPWKILSLAGDRNNSVCHRSFGSKSVVRIQRTLRLRQKFHPRRPRVRAAHLSERLDRLAPSAIQIMRRRLPYGGQPAGKKVA
jgi:hypothetical protein